MSLFTYREFVLSNKCQELTRVQDGEKDEPSVDSDEAKQELVRLNSSLLETNSPHNSVLVDH